MAVDPILASSLIAKEEIGLFEERTWKRLRVGTGCAAVDDALDGGFVYGRDGIYNISGATGSQGAETVSVFLSFCFPCLWDSAIGGAVEGEERWKVVVVRVIPFTLRYVYDGIDADCFGVDITATSDHTSFGL